MVANVAFAVFVLVIQKQCVRSHVNILKMEYATTVALAPITTTVPSDLIARWGFLLRMAFFNNCGVVSNLGPFAFHISFFSNTLFSL